MTVGMNENETFGWACAMCGAWVFDGEAGCGECGVELEGTIRGEQDSDPYDRNYPNYCRLHDYFDCPYH